jgi:hypothetical protein
VFRIESQCEDAVLRKVPASQQHIDAPVGIAGVVDIDEIVGTVEAVDTAEAARVPELLVGPVQPAADWPKYSPIVALFQS